MGQRRPDEPRGRRAWACSCASSAISRGTFRPTSSPSRSSASRPSTAPLGELDRRAGGELAALAAFGELTASATRARSTRAGEPARRRVLAIGRATPTRSIARSSSASARRSSGDSAAGPSSRLAVWLGDLGDAARRWRGRCRRAQSRAASSRAVRARHASTATARERAAGPRRADPRRTRRGRGRPGQAAERGPIIGEGANIARHARQPRRERRQPDRPGRARPRAHRRAARPVDRRHRAGAGAPSSGMGMFMAVGRGSDNPPRMIVHALGRGRGEGRARAATWPSSARASASTPAASASSRPTGWKR